MPQFKRLTGTTEDSFKVGKGGGIISRVLGTARLRLANLMRWLPGGAAIAGFLESDATGDLTIIKSNPGATVPPAVGNDNTQGYSVRSRWYDTTAKKEYVCLDASTGAADWKETTVSTAGMGDVVGPGSSVNNNVVFFDGVTGKLIKDSGLALSGSNTGDEVDATTSVKGIAELATDGETSAGVVVQGNDSRLSDARTPTGHGNTHTNGSDDVADLVGDSGSGGTHGLAPAPGAGDAAAGKFLKADGVWTTPSGGGDVAGPGSSIDQGMPVFSGTTGKVIADSGVRNYGKSATDPTSPTPADSDIYYNTALKMWMFYDASRSKFLSIEVATIQFSTTAGGDMAAGSFFKWGGGVRMSATRGLRAPFDGTVVGLQYTRDDTSSATFEAVTGGAAFSPAAELASSAVAGGTNALNSDFAANDILGVKNKSGGTTINDGNGSLFFRWRV